MATSADLRLDGLLGLGWVRDVGQLVQVEPFVGLLAVKVVNPVADAVLLVERGAGAAHVRDPASVLVAHVEQHAFELLVGVESERPVGAVERERHIGELLPAFGAMKSRQRVDERGGKGQADDQGYLTDHFN